MSPPAPVNLTSRGKRKAQIEEDDLALLNDVCRNLFWNRSEERCGAGHGGARRGTLRGATRWSALGYAAGRDAVDRAGVRCGAGHGGNVGNSCGTGRWVHVRESCNSSRSSKRAPKRPQEAPEAP